MAASTDITSPHLRSALRGTIGMIAAELSAAASRRRSRQAGWRSSNLHADLGSTYSTKTFILDTTTYRSRGLRER